MASEEKEIIRPRQHAAPDAKKPTHGILRRIGATLAVLIGGVAAVGVGEIVGFQLQPLLLEPIGGLSEIQIAFGRYIISQAIAITLLFGVLELLKANAHRVGLGGVKNWTYLLLLPLIYLACLLVSGLTIALIAYLIPMFNMEQMQDLGLPAITSTNDLLVTALLLVVVVPLAEEFIFRGYLFGMLRREMPFWLTALIVSILFGLAHGQWNVAIDTFILSLVLCFLREKTGSIWTGVGLHALKNFVAFLLLYVFNVV